MIKEKTKRIKIDQLHILMYLIGIAHIYMHGCFNI